jgi:4-hydroxybenzoate polyprenyltransferase
MSNKNKTQFIAVDLDGTITFTDTLHESVLTLVRNKPFFLFLLPFWLIKGVAYLKLKVAEISLLDVKTLPYNLPLIDWLKVQKTNGKKIILCTAANERVAFAVSEHLGFFDYVIASDANTNLKSTKKRNALEKRFGTKGYDYAGNSNADIEVWAGARHAIVVNASSAVHQNATQVTSVSHTFSSERVKISDWLRALRVHQWLKNLLLFVPILAAQSFDSIQTFNSLLMAFISFSLCASSVYITNDLLDLESDRQHTRKKHRPFASAKLSILVGISISIILAVLSIALGAIVGKDFLTILVLYIFLTSAYSLMLKSIVLVDCLTLATLYTVRIIAGAAAASLALSFWLLAFSVFIFLSLALVKRYAELLAQEKVGKRIAHGRGYEVSDAPLLQTLGVSSGYISALVMALYLKTDDIILMYTYPSAIWIFLPILLFWVSWVWLKASRGEMHDDPIVFAIKDKTSIFVALLTVVIFMYASTGMVI